MSKEPQNNKTNPVGIGLALGACMGTAIGAGIGAATDNMGFWNWYRCGD